MYTLTALQGTAAYVNCRWCVADRRQRVQKDAQQARLAPPAQLREAVKTRAVYAEIKNAETKADGVAIAKRHGVTNQEVRRTCR